MTKVESILITLDEPAKIWISEEPLNNFGFIFGSHVTSPPQFPLWATCADLLVNSVRELIGLCYYVGDDSKETVKLLLKTLDPITAQYINSVADKEAAPYLNCNLSPSHFQIKWSLDVADNIEIAQLDSDYWYYEGQGENPRLIALGVNYLNEILRDYNLKFPNIAHLNLFEPIFFHNKI